MKIGIQTWGSDGDITPFLALADGLQAAGHEVTVVYTSVENRDYSAYSQLGGFKSIKVFDRFEFDVEEAISKIIASHSPLKQCQRVMETFYNPAVEAMYRASLKLCRENDLVIGHVFGHTLLTAAEKTGCPRAVVALTPSVIRTRYAPMFGPNLNYTMNQLTWKLGDYIARKRMFSQAESIRKREGLAPLKSLQQELYTAKALTLLASSPTITARQPDWDNHIRICGDLRFNYPDRHIPLPEGLAEFLFEGSPPVYMTFGSLTPYEGDRMAQMMGEAAEKAGVRAIIQSSARGTPSANIFRCEKAPHATVFPHCAAVVHHGGAGTTHSALRAGCPSIVVEHAFDQRFWGTELQKGGVGAAMLQRKTMSADTLAAAISTTVTDTEMKQKARVLGKIMRFEDGVKTAVGFIEEAFCPKPEQSSTTRIQTLRPLPYPLGHTQPLQVR